jgi:hypothetical protein
MNYNILAYCCYFAITLFILLFIGHVLYKNGRPFLLTVFPDNETKADHVNKMLITCFYLTKIGYVTLVLKVWNKIESLQEMINILSFKVGIIVLILGILHFVNIVILVYIGKIRNQKQLIK